MPPPSDSESLGRRIQALSRPEAYLHPVDRVEVRQTHISCVFLAGEFAYKLKKPVNLGFVDYRRLVDRVHFSEEEVRINRRLAPTVYLGLEWVRERDGELFCFGDGSPVEVLVKMQRLSDLATFASRLERGAARAADYEQLAERLVPFFQSAEAGPRAARNASLSVVAKNARENFDGLRPFMQSDSDRRNLEALAKRTEQLIEELGPCIDRRAESLAVETHGDLRLEHVYRLAEGPSGLVVIDAVEFSERFRFADPAADLAFLVMELYRDGGAQFAKVFIERYVQLSGDEEVKQLLPFYVAYRALVRAKVEYLKTREPELPAAEVARAPARALEHIELALRSLGLGSNADDRAGGLADHFLGDAANDEV